MQKMTMGDMRISYINPNTLVKVFDGMRLTYAGPAFLIPKECDDRTVGEVKIDVETRRRDWQTQGTWAPLNPETIPELEFKDMEQRIYWRITLERSGHEQERYSGGAGTA